VPEGHAALPLHDELQRDVLPLLVEHAELLQLHLLHLLSVSGKNIQALPP
jgi:hypothetical protein